MYQDGMMYCEQKAALVSNFAILVGEHPASKPPGCGGVGTLIRYSFYFVANVQRVSRIFLSTLVLLQTLSEHLPAGAPPGAHLNDERETHLSHGVETMTLAIKESEAAALFTLHNLNNQGPTEGDAITVCLAGTGTVDLVSYEISRLSPLKLKELLPATGGVADSGIITKRFEE